MSDIRTPSPTYVSPATARPPEPAGSAAASRANEQVTVSQQDKDNLHKALLDHLDTNPLLLNLLPAPQAMQSLVPQGDIRNDQLTRAKEQGIKV